MIDVAKWAGYLLDAEKRREAVPPITDVEPDLSVEEGYNIQHELIQQRVGEGEVVVGAKLGLTSKAKQEAMRIAEPVYGVLTDAMLLTAEEPIVLSELIHPRVEPEIVFVLSEDLAGPGVTLLDVLNATAAVGSALEVIDSRYEAFRFKLPDVVADNTSAARFVLGPELVEPAFDLSLVGCLFEIDGELVATAAGAAALGHPAEPVARLANWLGGQGQRLRAGWKILSGALTDAVALQPGTHATATLGRLGRITLRAVP